MEFNANMAFGGFGLIEAIVVKNNGFGSVEEVINNHNGRFGEKEVIIGRPDFKSEEIRKAIIKQPHFESGGINKVIFEKADPASQNEVMIEQFGYGMQPTTYVQQQQPTAYYQQPTTKLPMIPNTTESPLPACSIF